MRDIGFFSRHYQEARSRFLRDGEKVCGERHIEAWQVPGSRDTDLFVDSLWLPPTAEAETLFVITSGIHGAESYTGSAVQSLLLEEFVPRVDRSRTGLWVVHGMNPFGFKHHRRGTENHVNLNRNFSLSGEIFRTKNERARELNERFLERRAVGSLQSRLLDSVLRRGDDIFFEDVSLDDFVKGISLGQFESADHWEYGGTRMEPQSEAFTETLRRLAPSFHNIVGLDVHTGLGDRGRLHLLIGGESETCHADLFQKLFQTKVDQDLYEFTPPEEDGFYETLGAINSIFGECARPDQSVVSLTMEFGTLGHSLEAQVEGLNRFVLEHQGRFFGYESEELKQRIETLNLEKYYPQDDLWRGQVIGASRGLLERVFRRAGAL